MNTAATTCCRRCTRAGRTDNLERVRYHAREAAKGFYWALACWGVALAALVFAIIRAAS